MDLHIVEDMVVASSVKGPYLGDVTAICFLKLPWSSQFPSLLAGTGPQVDCYDLVTGQQFFSEHVFDGVRVHGLHVLQETTFPGVAIVGVHGERRVKLYNVKHGPAQCQLSLRLWQTIPRFTKWVLDIRILQESNTIQVAVGLSDNSVCLWDTSVSQMLCQVDCSEKCLLYSMRLWGDAATALRVAAGTIFNEVLVWEFDCNSSKVVEPSQKCCGHEGSIYRITWSDNGELFGSVSDDRSARLWKFSDSDSQALCVLYGHAARVWDLHIDDKILVTASEDCTCGVWSSDGKILATVRGHVGRGIWRCIYDSQTAVLVTAGADASIKLHCLSKWDKCVNTTETTTESFSLSITRENSNLDSQSEYVRCLRFSGPSSLYVATNHGMLYHVYLSTSGSEEWHTILKGSVKYPIVCLDILVNATDEDFVACGDGKGNATAVKFDRSKSHLNLIWKSTWLAQEERQLLGIFWCRRLGSQYLFTADPNGGLDCWIFNYVDDVPTAAPELLFSFKSSLSSRIVCIDVCQEKQLLVCGDQRGNLITFTFSVAILCSSTKATESCSVFRGAHGVSAVASVSIYPQQVVSTGRDGCICKFVYDGQQLSCVGVEKVSAITVVENSFNTSKGSLKKRIAAGFSAADFVLWDLTDDVEVKRITCGGWRRPHSFLVEHSSQLHFCFAYIKENVICVQRSWKVTTENERTLGISSLQKQFHGKEIHTVVFLPHTKDGIDWILTGSEDGLVQITRYSHGKIEKLTVHANLGEHVGGSAVRALAVSANTNGSFESTTSMLLFSVGAKEVITCWLLEQNVEEEDDDDISATWLSSCTSRTQQKDDLRYLAVTVFSVESASTGSMIYFLVTSLSNAVLSVKAFDPATKKWYDAAKLDYHKAPVLALQHVIMHGEVSKRYVALSGSTDGSTAVWDLTKVVDEIMGRIVKQGGEDDDANLRPLSGRGSKGGKQRYRNMKPSTVTTSFMNKVKENDCQQMTTLQPLLILPTRHQSGVNCMHVSSSYDDETSVVCIVSGGDDQALHSTTLHLPDEEMEKCEVVSQCVIPNAHTSALKGVWSDGKVIFSTGLDQRLRCWNYLGEVEEECWCVIDVPEAAALHVLLHSPPQQRLVYRIAIVGRGLQIVNFVQK